MGGVGVYLKIGFFQFINFLKEDIMCKSLVLAITVLFLAIISMPSFAQDTLKLVHRNR